MIFIFCNYLHVYLSASIFNVDSTATNRVTVRLNDSCVEDPTTFVSTLSYGPCPNYILFQKNETFSSSSTAEFVLNTTSVTGELLCIRVVVAHQSQLNRPLNTLDQQLTLNSCAVASINSIAGSRVSVQFSSPENSGMFPHGTVAMFGSSSSAYTLVGPSQSTCRNGQWTSLDERHTKRE